MNFQSQHIETKYAHKLEKRRRRGFIGYIAVDLIMSILSWALFFYIRKSKEAPSSFESIVEDSNFYLGIVIIPMCWLMLYALFDEYTDVYRKSRLSTLSWTFIHTLIGSLLIFFFLLLDDVVTSYRNYYWSILTLFLLQFLLVSTSRMVFLTRIKNQVKKGIVKFNTLLVGNNKRALDCYKDIVERPESLGYHFVGYIDAGERGENLISKHLPKLGELNDITEVVNELSVEEVILAVDGSQNNDLRLILSDLFGLKNHILIKIIPQLYDILLGHVKMNHLYGAVLIEIEREIMPRWERLAKRSFDVLSSIIVLILLSPLLAIVALRVKLSSEGPVFFKQKRVGFGGKEFEMFKFRSMYVDAEKNGPRLSFDGDPRVTAWGSTMRKYRLDELPQFWNVLKGDMSFVGPRPERRYFVDQLLKRAPHYNHLFSVRPGITSWGMVKYGYASNIEEMLERLKFDLLYVENRSLALDVKILFYTLLVIIKGDGK